MIVDRPLREKVIEEAKRNGCYFLNGEEKLKLENTVAKGAKLNADIVGKPAAWIAKYAGFTVPKAQEMNRTPVPIPCAGACPRPGRA